MTKVNSQLTGYRRGADLVSGYLAAIFSVLGLVQIFLAGDRDFELHTTVGRTLAALAMAIFILALVARQSKAVIIATLALALLAGVATTVLAQSSLEWTGGLHAVVGVVSVAIAGSLSGRAFKGSAK